MTFKKKLYHFLIRLPDFPGKYKPLCWWHNSRGHNFKIIYRQGLFHVQYQNGVNFQLADDPYQDLAVAIPGYLKYYQPRMGDIIIDGGAYIGAFTILAAKLVGPSGKIIAFEPDPGNFARLKTNVALNHLNNVILINKGLWSEETDLTLNLAGNGSSLIPDQLPGRPPTVIVPVTTIDRARDQLGLSRVDFIKMDIEGAEIPALTGARQTIKAYSPKLAIASYHLVEDQLTAPQVERLIIDLSGQPHTSYPKHLTTYA